MRVSAFKCWLKVCATLPSLATQLLFGMASSTIGSDWEVNRDLSCLPHCSAEAGGSRVPSQPGGWGLQLVGQIKNSSLCHKDPTSQQTQGIQGYSVSFSAPSIVPSRVLGGLYLRYSSQGSPRLCRVERG